MAAGKYEFNDLTVESCFEKFYIVPDYQREYVWEADKHVAQLMNDVYEAYSSNKLKEYFIGTTVVYDNNGENELIDGQQRTTTLFLTLCAFCNIYKQRGLGATTMEQHIYNSTYDDNGEEVHKFHLELQYIESTNLLENLYNDTTDMVLKSNSAIRLVAAYKYIHQFIVDNTKDDDDELKGFFIYFYKRLKFIQILTPDINDALKIFETINDRGAGLNPMDLLKNLIFRQVGRDNFEPLKAKWKQLVEILEGGKEKPLRFLRYFIMSNYPSLDNNGDPQKPENVVREDEIYTWANSHADVCNYVKKPYDFVQLLIENAECYVKFSRGKNVNGDSNAYLDNINRLAGGAFRQHQILLLAARKFSVEMFDYLCKCIETYLFYCLVNKEQAKIYEKQFGKWDLSLSKIHTMDELVAFVQSNIQPEIERRRLEFKSRFLNFRQGDLQVYRVRYILAKLTQYIDFKRTGGQLTAIPLLNYYKSGVEIEHILPQTPSPELRAQFEDYDQLVYRLGNLTLLEKSINCVVSNKEFSEKVKDYGASQFYLTSSIYNIQDVGINSAVVQTNHLLKSFDEWNEESINERQMMMFNLAEQIWNLDI